MDEKIECPECEGERVIYIDTSTRCGKPMNNCCGGCGYDVQCSNCLGEGEVEL